MEKFDIVIIGAGISGAALAYVLKNYSNAGKVAIVDKESGAAKVQSSRDNNSQTLHFGDIETNYTLEKAKRVSAGAVYVKSYVERKESASLYEKFPKMVLGVGEEEISFLKRRFDEFKELFPNLRLIDEKEISQIEPEVIKGRKEPVVALYSPEGYAVDYGALTEEFIADAKAKGLKLYYDKKVKSIKELKKGYVIEAGNISLKANFVVVAASSNSLNFAHKLGYKRNLLLLPVGGDFFKSKGKLNGKVYMVQDPKLPFAAVHGDPAVGVKDETRYGPVAKVLPLLEKGRFLSFFDFVSLFNFKFRNFKALFSIISDRTYFKFAVTNFLYSIPFFGKYGFAREVRKIIPSIKSSEIALARGVGGVRPQIVDSDTGKAKLGEAKIVGKNILFNITPSPGASICLQSALEDIEQISLQTGLKFDKEKFMKDHS